MEFPKVLALDFGTERVGVAISFGTLAEPLIVLPQDEFIFEALQKIIDENKVTQIIIGVSENKSAERTFQFAKELQKKIVLPLEFVDETLSTQTARKKLKETGRLSSEVADAVVDHLAAAEILQDWLDEKN